MGILANQNVRVYVLPLITSRKIRTILTMQYIVFYNKAQ